MFLHSKTFLSQWCRLYTKTQYHFLWYCVSFSFALPVDLNLLVIFVGCREVRTARQININGTRSVRNSTKSIFQVLSGAPVERLDTHFGRASFLFFSATIYNTIKRNTTKVMLRFFVCYIYLTTIDFLVYFALYVTPSTVLYALTVK